MNAMLAVVPAVLGRPLAVLGHFSEQLASKINKLGNKNIKSFLLFVLIIFNKYILIISDVCLESSVAKLGF